MTHREPYEPGAASGARIDKQVAEGGEKWTLVLVRDLAHPPAKVWKALTQPEHLREWAPFDADRSLDAAGTTAKLTTIGAPALHVTETKVKRADAPRALEFSWGGQDIRWELEAVGSGTRLTLWHNINRNFIAMGAAGWHVCFDVLDRFLANAPVGRIVGPDAMKVAGWQRLHAEYANQLGVPLPAWSSNKGG